MRWMRRMRRMRRAWRDEAGSTLPLVIFLGALGLALVLLVSAASSLYLERKRLFTLADGAALVGAEAFELADVEVTPSGIRPRLAPASVATAVQEYLDAAPVDRFEQLRLVRATTLDGQSATVTVSSQWRPPLVSVFVPDGVRLEATAVARAVWEEP